MDTTITIRVGKDGATSIDHGCEPSSRDDYREIRERLHLLSKQVEELREVVVRSGKAEMRAIDEATTSIGIQLDEIAQGSSAEQAQRLRALAATLNSMGKPVDPPPDTKESHGNPQ